jgi:hypothetical protein
MQPESPPPPAGEPACAKVPVARLDPLSAWAGGLAALVLVLGRVFPHSTALQGLLWPCPLKLASGVPCVTCGITRVSVDLAHGEVLDALALAPLPTLALLFCLGLGTAALVAWIRRRRGPDRLVLWLLITTPGRATLGVLVLGLYAWTLVRFTATGLP